jgi:hypothetical protein
MVPMSNESILFLKARKHTAIVLLVLFLLGGVAVRLIDVNDLPLDFAATRQLHSLIMARGIYYEFDTPQIAAIPEAVRNFGITTGNAEPRIEPPVMEYLAALTYQLIGGENIFVGRIYSIIFWVLGGIPLFLLMRRITSANGSFASLAVYLFMPFGVIASRAFQPDPLMVMGILWALYFQIRWMQEDSIRYTILAGVFTGIVILIKATSIYFVGIPLVGIVLSMGFKKWIRNWHIYLMAALALLPALLFNVISATVGGNAGAILGSRFFPSLFIDPKWYLRWFMTAKSVVNYFPLIIGLIAFFLIKKKEYRVFYGCLWLGYLLFGFTFAYHIYTHNYYHLPLIPMVAIGFGVMFEVVFRKLEEINSQWLPRLLIAGILMVSIGICAFKVRSDLLEASYRHEAAYWEQLGAKIGMNKAVIALTHDYGYRISYWGNINPKLWRTRGDQVVQELSGATNPEFETLFKQEIEGKDYFLVTLIGDFEAQTDLHNYLLANYSFEQGEGYYLFDLKSKITEGN